MATAVNTQEKITKLKAELAKINEYIVSMKGLSRTAIYRKYMPIAREDKRRLELQIWKLEDPESFENHRQALKDFIEHGGFIALFEDYKICML